MPIQNPNYPGKWPVIVALWLFLVGVTLFWMSFFFGGQVQTSTEDSYIMFERTFVAADFVTAIAAVICAEGLRRNRDWALVWGGGAAGGILFLGCMDVSYNLLHGMYHHVTGAMLLENGINIYCFTFGPYLIWYLLRNRGAGHSA